MMNKFMKRAAIFIAMAGALVGLTVSLSTVYDVAGGWGLLAGLLLFPLTFVYLPIYAVFAQGNWALLFLNYGSIAVSWLLLYLADKQEERPRRAVDEPLTQPVATKDNPSPAIILLVVGGVIFAAIVCALSLRAISISSGF